MKRIKQGGQIGVVQMAVGFPEETLKQSAEKEPAMAEITEQQASGGYKGPIWGSVGECEDFEKSKNSVGPGHRHIYGSRSHGTFDI